MPRLTLVAAGSSLLGLFLGLSAVLVLPGQYVSEVRFVGERQAHPRALRHLADIHRGTRLWGVDRHATARAVERHPWVKHAEVSLDWPAGVEISVVEYTPVFLVQYGDELLYVSEQGDPIIRAKPPLLDLPVLTGLAPELDRLHPDIPKRVVQSALSLVRMLDDRGVVTRDLVSEINFRAARGFTVIAGQSRLLFGLSGHDRQADRLVTLVRRGDVAVHLPLYVDLAPETVAIVRPMQRHGDG